MAKKPDAEKTEQIQMSGVMIAFDVETTGKNPETDQIVEISMCLYETGRERTYHRLVKPGIPITRGAQAVHGISMEDVADAPGFADIADDVEQFLDRADVLVGYNVRFDIRVVESEFARIGREIDLGSRLVVDPYRIWQSLEPRTLSDAYRRFVGGELENAHSAEHDVQAAVNVLRGIRRTFNLEETSWEELARMSNPGRDTWIGNTNHFVWSHEQVIVNFGKYNGRPLLEVAERDRGYLEWIKRSDFPAHVQNLCKGALSGLDEDDFNERIVRSFGAPPIAEEEVSEKKPEEENSPGDDH